MCLLWKLFPRGFSSLSSEVKCFEVGRNKLLLVLFSVSQKPVEMFLLLYK